MVHRRSLGALALAMMFGLPSVTSVESANPANLPRTASSVVASRIESHGLLSGHQSPGFLVLHRQGALTTQDDDTIHAILGLITAHPLPLEVGSVAFQGTPATGLARVNRVR